MGQFAQRLNKNIGAYFGESIDLQQVLCDDLEAARKFGWQIEKLPVSGHYNIVLTTRRRGTIPTGLWNSSYMIFLADGAVAAREERARIPEKLLRTR